MKYLLVVITLCFAGSFYPRAAISNTSANVHKSYIELQFQYSAATASKHKLPGYPQPCTSLKTNQPEKRTLTSRGPACFTVEVGADETTQLLLDQPSNLDLEMRVTSESGERRIDGFEFGIETLTIAGPGIYSVEVAKADSSPVTLAFSIVRWKLEMKKAAAWQQAEDWATAAKKSRKIEDIDRSLALWVDLGDTSSIARTYLKQGSVVNASNPASARTAYEKALELCRATFDTRCSAEAGNNSGQMSSRLGSFSEAHQRLEEAARDWQRIADKANEGATLSNLGLLLWQSGDFGQAIPLLNQAEGLLRNRNAVRHAQTLNNLGLCYQSLAEYGRARRYFGNAMRGFVRGKSLPDLISARMNLGRNYMLEDNLQRAQKILESSVAEANERPDLQLRANTLRNLAQCLYKMGKLDQASPRLELALEVDRQTGNRRGQSSALHYLGLIAQKHGDTATARTLLSQALQLRLDVGLRDDATETLFALADLEYHDGHPEAANGFAEQALKLLESVRSQVPSPALRAFYYSRKRQFFDLLVELAMLPGNPNAVSDGLLAVERGRGRALLDWLASSPLPGQWPDSVALRRANNQRQIEYLSYLLARTALGKDAELRLQFQKLLDENDALEDSIRRSLAQQNIAQPLQSIEKLQSELLASDSALLEYYLGAKQSYLWFVDAHGIKVFTLPRTATIQSASAPVVNEYGRILDRRRSTERDITFEQALQKLSRRLLGQLVETQLPQRLILVLDGVLHRVPFAALELPHSAGRLGLVHDLVQVPSAAYFMAGKQPPPISQFPKTILAVADPVFSSNDSRVIGDHLKPQANPGIDLPRLAFNREIDMIEELVPPARRRTLRGFAASTATLSHLRLEDFGVVHLSTHALIDDLAPELSRITLSMVTPAGRPVDGILRPYQLAQFHLAGSTVVLSACDTALGKQVSGEGLMGFSSSLFYAGASQLVLTITKIDADASSHFLSDVYLEFLPKGTRSMEHSVTLARRAMVRDHRYSDPYYWASFIVIGRPAGTGSTGTVSMEDRR